MASGEQTVPSDEQSGVWHLTEGDPSPQEGTDPCSERRRVRRRTERGRKRPCDA